MKAMVSDTRGGQGAEEEKITSRDIQEAGSTRDRDWVSCGGRGAGGGRENVLEVCSFGELA